MCYGRSLASGQARRRRRGKRDRRSRRFDRRARYPADDADLPHRWGRGRGVTTACLGFRKSSRLGCPRARRRSRKPSVGSRIQDEDGKGPKIVVVPDDGSEEQAFSISRRVHDWTNRRGPGIAQADGDRVEVGELLHAAVGQSAPVLRVLGQRQCRYSFTDQVQDGGRRGCVDPRQAHRDHRAADAAPDHRAGK